MIKELTLTNFKCFRDEPIALSNLNLLTGLNGMGKSSVIQSLLLLRQNAENGLLSLRKQLGLNGDYIKLGTSSDVLYRYFSNKDIGIKIVNSNDKFFEWHWDAIDNLDILPESSSAGDLFLQEESLFGTEFHYLNAERIGPRPFYETSSTKVIHENQLGTRGELASSYFVHKRDGPLNIPSLAHSSSQGSTLYEQVNGWLSLIRPGTKVVVKEQPDSGTVSLHFEFVLGQDNPGSYRASNVGFGLTYVFPLIVAILSSKPGTLLLLENPEAHIHPQGQAELGILLAKAASAGVQLIVETHSDHILNGVRYAIKQDLLSPDLTQLIFFTGSVHETRFVHHTRYVAIDKNGKLGERPKGFFDTWDDLLIKLI